MGNDNEKTNITEDHKDAFRALRNPEFVNFCLVSCFVNGEPTSAIAAVTHDENDGLYQVTPLFVAVTPDMKIEDHEGVEPYRVNNG